MKTLLYVSYINMFESDDDNCICRLLFVMYNVRQVDSPTATLSVRG